MGDATTDIFALTGSRGRASSATRSKSPRVRLSKQSRSANTARSSSGIKAGAISPTDTHLDEPAIASNNLIVNRRKIPFLFKDRKRFRKTALVLVVKLDSDCMVKTHEGVYRAKAGDYLVANEHDLYWPWVVKREIFEQTYAAVGTDDSEYFGGEGSHQ
jgi:hypothetical protein